MKRYVTKEELMNELGLAGEKIITSMLSKLGCQVEPSYDKYDSKKDLLVDGKKVEVKTQIPFAKKKAFTFSPWQLKKCQSVDVLYFIAIPNTNPKYDLPENGWIYRVVPSEFKHEEWKDRWGKPRILVPIKQDCIFPVERLTEEQVKYLQSYTTSSYSD